MAFFEVFWYGEAISDHTVPQDALLDHALVRSEDGDWMADCAASGADPHPLRYELVEAFLHNANALVTIPVSAAMIEFPPPVSGSTPS